MNIVQVKDVFNLQMGKTPSRKNYAYWTDGNIDWVSIRDLGTYDRFVGNTRERITQLAIDESGIKPVPPGTLIMSFKLSLGKTAITVKPTYTNEAIMAFIDKGRYPIDLGYLFHQFSAKDWTAGTNMAVMGETLNKKTLSEAWIMLPGENEQRRIAGLLDAVCKRTANAKELLKMLDELVKSRFVEMFGTYDEDSFVPLKDVCSIITDGTHQPPKFHAEGIPFLFVSNIANDALTYETGKYITEEDYRTLIKRTPIEVGDVLVSAVGSFGHPAIVREERPFCFQRHIAYLKPIREMIDSDYLHAALLSEHSQRYMDQAAKGVAQRTVTLKGFKELRIPLPPLALQQEFAAFVQQVDKLKFETQQAIDKLQMLYDSLAQEYFGRE